MTSDTAAHWSNYWQGRAGTEKGAALVGVGIENDGEITAFWDEALTSFAKDSRLLDLACGAGSVIRSADALGFTNVAGADISEGAIIALTREFPQAEGHVVAADDTKLPEASFDIIVSQFGFEYAGAPQTMPEIARLLKPGGHFIALVHKTGSAIETEVNEKCGEAKGIVDTNFIAAAKALFTADNTPGDETAFNEAVSNFRPAQDKLLALARAHEGLAAHLYSGTQTMFEKRENYALEDVIKWLDGMEAEISAFYGRMQSMVEAALNEDDVAAVSTAAQAVGLTCEAPDVFCTGFEANELAWIIKASKPQESKPA